MAELFKILLNALPEAIGGLIAASVIGLVSYLFVKKFKKQTSPTIIPKEIIAEPPKPEIPSNLPPRSAFVGREKEKRLIKEALLSRWPLICIDGIGGIGKTSLVLEVVSECLDASKNKLEATKQIESDIPIFHGFIWTSAKDRELKLNDVLDGVARTLDWPGIAQQPVEEKRESVRKLLQTKRYLVVVDNFETITDESIRDFLLKLPEPSKALITSREQKLPQAWAVSIKGLEQDEAIILIRNEGQRLGLKSIEKAEDLVLIHLYQATGGAPLAIKWAVGQIKQKGQSLDTVLSALHEAKGDIFEEVFVRSWSLLNEDARKVLMVMPIFASSASKDAIEAASDLHHFTLDEALGQLVQMWLVEVTDELEAAKRRYSVHPLTRAFAEQKLEKKFTSYNNAFAQTLNYYLKFVEQFGNQNFDFFDFLEPEKDNIIKIIEHCFRTEDYFNGIELVKKMHYFFGVRGYWLENLKYGTIALEMAKKFGYEKSAGYLLTVHLGWLYFVKGDPPKASMLIEEGISISNIANDLETAAWGFRSLGMIAIDQLNLKQAKGLLQKALRIAQEKQDNILINVIYSDLGELAKKNKNFIDAESLLRKSLSGLENLGDILRMATRYSSLADLLLLQHRFTEAKECYMNGLKISVKYKNQGQIALIKYSLSKISEHQKNYHESIKLISEAYEIFEKLGVKKYIDEAQTMIERLSKQLH